jgi:hypothetical protein
MVLLFDPMFFVFSLSASFWLDPEILAEVLDEGDGDMMLLFDPVFFAF